jgi:hypothetical protein
MEDRIQQRQQQQQPHRWICIIGKQRLLRLFRNRCLIAYTLVVEAVNRAVKCLAHQRVLFQPRRLFRRAISSSTRPV